MRSRLVVAAVAVLAGLLPAVPGSPGSPAAAADPPHVLVYSTLLAVLSIAAVGLLSAHAVN